MNKNEYVSKCLKEIIDNMETLLVTVSKDPLVDSSTINGITERLNEVRSEHKKSVLNENKTKRGNG